MRRRATLLASCIVVSLCTLSACALFPSQPARSTVMPPAPIPEPSPVSTTAALNGRLLVLATPSTGPADLPVGPGDLVEVSVFEVEELSKLKLRIPLRGAIALPLIGQVEATGRTATELEHDIRARLQARYMHDPQVSVFILEHKSQRISVLGAVKNGGVFPLTGRLRVADGLALAQGLAEDAEQVAYLIRRVPKGAVHQASTAAPPAALGGGSGEADEVMMSIDLEALAGGRSELNVELVAGDILQVPRAGSYYVGGLIERPGSFLLRSKVTVHQAIVAAGGPRAAADWADVRLYRPKPGGDPGAVTYDLSAFEQGQAAPEVQKGDVIVVGRSATKSFFYGVMDVFKGVFNFGISTVPGL